MILLSNMTKNVLPQIVRRQYFLAAQIFPEYNPRRCNEFII